VPNATIFSGVITNYTGERLRRVKFKVPVDHFNDLARVEQTILGALTADTMVIKDPAPSVVVSELQEYAVVMTARAYVRSPDYWQALYKLQRDVKDALDKAGILIAVPRQAAAIREEPDAKITAPPDAG
jgi:small conductance mechanosensitive channel